jgi:hypothetical protein
MLMYIPEGVVGSSYAPRVTATGEHFYVPVASKYMDDPSYFRQITSGRDINDVIHGKLVSELGSLQYLNGTLDNGYRFTTTGDSSSCTSSFYHGSIGRKDGLITIKCSCSCRYRALKGWYTSSLYGQAMCETTLLDDTGRRAYTAGRVITGQAGYPLIEGSEFGTFSQAPVDEGSPFAGLIGNVSNLFAPAEYYSKRADAERAAIDAARRWSLTWGYALYSWMTSDAEMPMRIGSRRSVLRVTGYDGVPDLRRFFILKEPEIYGERVDPILLGNGLESRSYQRNWLIQHAYQDALSSAPKLNDNSISNIIELVSFIKSLVIERRIEIPRRLQDAWLQYRYVYNTTKMDVNEAIKFMKRSYGQDLSRKTIRTFGSASREVDGTLVTCKCGIDLTPVALGNVERIWKALYTYGLQPNFYVVWDSIPFSFIVDWFIPVGDLASNLDLEANMLRGQYTLSNVCFSLSYVRKAGDYNVKCFTRWASDPLTTLNDLYWFDRPGPSDKITCFRILDTASLVVG